MSRFKVHQRLLFKAETVYHLKPLEKYEILFSFLDTSSLERLYANTGRPPVGYESLLKALIYKNMKNISYFSDLVRVLKDHPDLAIVFGFHPLRLPQVENFSAFLADTDNGMLQEVRNALVKQLIQSGEIRGKYLAFDSTNIPVKVKENNLKTSVKDRFKKNRRPKGDPESRLGVMIHFPKPFQKKIRYFWGYRNFVLSDAWSELPLVEETRPANVVDSKIILICLAGFEMIYWGKYKEGKRTRTKFVCPIIHSRKFREEHPYCPWMHPQFVKAPVVLPTYRWWMKTSVSRLLMGVEGSRKSITCAVARKGSSPGYWNWSCKIRVSGDYRLSPITVLLPISQFYWLP